MKSQKIPTPCKAEIKKYLLLWNTLESYVLQENALNKLFLETYPSNTDINDILIKVSALNDFYSTNIFSVFPVAKHILKLNIDKSLSCADATLVDDIAKAGKNKHFYSFATKYCSHHYPNDFPIYDSFVEKILMYFKSRDGFETFSKDDLKSYPKYKNIFISFKKFYNIDEYSLKDIDRYLWQLGKKYFPKKYK